MAKRRAKSSIKRLPPEQRAEFERVIRSDSMTLDEIIAHMRAKFPGEPAADISRSALHRYSTKFAEMTERMREMQGMAEVLVGDFGESIGEKSGTLLTQSILTLITDISMKRQGDEKVSIEDARKLAMAAKHAIDSQRVDMNVRRTIREEARKQLIVEQEQKLSKVAKTAGLSTQTVQDIRAEILGLNRD